jgi:hypothetical protein
MATILQATPHGKPDRPQRWARLDRADLFARYDDLHTQGLSQRQAAKVLDVPRSPLQAWRLYQDRLDACPAVVACLHRVPGLACLPRLVLALPLVCVAIGACGMRLGGLVLELTGLNRFVGASYGTQQQGNRRVAEAIVAYRREAGARLAHAMPPQDITLTQDATFTGGLCVVGMEPVSNSMVVEQAAPTRDHDTWQAHMEQALVGLNGRGMQSTSAAAPGLLASVEQPRGAPHSPDLFPGQHALSQAVSAPRAVKQRAAAKAGAQAEETRMRVHAYRAHGTPDRRGPGRPPKAVARLEQAAQDVATTRHESQRLAGQRETVTQSIRAMGHASHCVDWERGVRRNGKRSAGDIQRHIDTLRPMAPHAHRSETGLKRLAQAERVVPTRQATLEFVSG